MIEFEEFKMPVGRLALFGLGKALVHAEAVAGVEEAGYVAARKELVKEFRGRIEGVEGGIVTEYAPGRYEVEFLVELIPGEAEAFYGEAPRVMAVGC